MVYNPENQLIMLYTSIMKNTFGFTYGKQYELRVGDRGYFKTISDQGTHATFTPDRLHEFFREANNRPDWIEKRELVALRSMANLTNQKMYYITGNQVPDLNIEHIMIIDDSNTEKVFYTNVLNYYFYITVPEIDVENFNYDLFTQSLLS